MSHEPAIRQARRSDAAAMKVCVEAAYRHYIERMGKPPGPMLDDYAEVVARHGAFVAERAGEIVGVLVLIRTQGGMLLDNVAVHPNCQGAGLGRRLIALAESEASREGYETLDLYTHECMVENIAMYEAPARIAHRFARGSRRALGSQWISRPSGILSVLPRERNSLWTRGTSETV